MQLLTGETLIWVTYDRQRVASVALRGLLRERLQATGIKLELIVAGSLDETAAQVEQQRAGLLTLAPAADDDEASLWRLLRRVHLRRPQCIRCVALSRAIDEGKTAGELPRWDRLRLLETGAQIVVDELPWYDAVVDKIIAHAPRRSGGNHPLTFGLLDRLPLL